jgi:hypothetical protein
LPPAVPSSSPGEKWAWSRSTCKRRGFLSEDGEEAGEGLAEGSGVGVAWAGAVGETVPNGFGVGSVPTAGPGAMGDASVAGGVIDVGDGLGVASVVAVGAGVGGGSDLDEQAAATVASSSADGTAMRRRLPLISDVSSS